MTRLVLVILALAFAYVAWRNRPRPPLKLTAQMLRDLDSIYEAYNAPTYAGGSG